MMKSVFGVLSVLCLMTATAEAQPPQRPQQPPPPSQPGPAVPFMAGPTVPLRVQVVLTTYQGEKKLSSVPYTMSVNATSGPFPGVPSQMRMGVKVPVPAMAPSTIDGKPINMGGGPVVYQDIGTNIDCTAVALDDGRFQLHISIEDQSFANPQSAITRPGEPPIIRSFRLSNQVVLKDGQSTQFTAATDRVSGEVVRAEVTLTVSK
jgi:hypothetical protein